MTKDYQNINHRSNEKKTSAEGIKAVIDQSLQTYEKLPMLQIIFDKLIRLLTISLRNFTSETVDIEIKSFSSIRFSNWLNKAKQQSSLGVFKVVQWNGQGLVVISNELSFYFIDVLLGGKKNTDYNADFTKPHTYLEQSVIKQIIEVLLHNFGEAFDLVSTSTFVLERLESNPNLTTIARPGDPTILLEMVVDLDGRKGNLHLLIPYETIEPIKKDLQQVFIGDKNKDDAGWKNLMQKNILEVNLGLEAVIIDENINFQKVAHAKIGDTLMTNNDANDKVHIMCENKKLFDATIGKIDKKVAANIISPSDTIKQK